MDARLSDQGMPDDAQPDDQSLPADVLHSVFAHLSCKGLANAACVCKSWHEVSQAVHDLWAVHLGVEFGLTRVPTWAPSAQWLFHQCVADPSCTPLSYDARFASATAHIAASGAWFLRLTQRRARVRGTSMTAVQMTEVNLEPQAQTNRQSLWLRFQLPEWVTQGQAPSVRAQQQWAALSAVRQPSRALEDERALLGAGTKDEEEEEEEEEEELVWNELELYAHLGGAGEGGASGGARSRTAGGGGGGGTQHSGASSAQYSDEAASGSVQLRVIHAPHFFMPAGDHARLLQSHIDGLYAWEDEDTGACELVAYVHYEALLPLLDAALCSSTSSAAQGAAAQGMGFLGQVSAAAAGSSQACGGAGPCSTTAASRTAMVNEAPTEPGESLLSLTRLCLSDTAAGGAAAGGTRSSSCTPGAKGTSKNGSSAPPAASTIHLLDAATGQQLACLTPHHVAAIRVDMPQVLRLPKADDYHAIRSRRQHQHGPHPPQQPSSYQESQPSPPATAPPHLQCPAIIAHIDLGQLGMQGSRSSLVVRLEGELATEEGGTETRAASDDGVTYTMPAHGGCVWLPSTLDLAAMEATISSGQAPTLSDATLLGCSAVAAPWRHALLQHVPDVSVYDAGLLLQLDRAAGVWLQQVGRPAAAAGIGSSSTAQPELDAGASRAAAALHASISAAVAAAHGVLQTPVGASKDPTASGHAALRDHLWPLHRLAAGLEQEGMLDFALFAAGSESLLIPGASSTRSSHFHAERSGSDENREAAAGLRGTAASSGASAQYREAAADSLAGGGGVAQGGPRPGQLLLGRCGVETWSHERTTTLAGQEVDQAVHRAHFLVDGVNQPLFHNGLELVWCDGNWDHTAQGGEAAADGQLPPGYVLGATGCGRMQLGLSDASLYQMCRVDVMAGGALTGSASSAQ